MSYHHQEDVDNTLSNVKLTKKPSKWNLLKQPLNILKYGSASSTSQRAIKQQVDYLPYFVTSNEATIPSSNQNVVTLRKQGKEELSKINCGKLGKKHIWQASAEARLKADRFERQARQNRRVRGKGKDAEAKEEGYW